jgi:heme exporter protein C
MNDQLLRRPPAPTKRDWSRVDFGSWLVPLALLTGALGLATVFGAFIYAPTDAIQGDVQRIFYIHAPMAMIAYVAGGVVALAGLVYLKTRNMFWDVIARCSAEIAVLFTTLVLITGSLWGKPVWGTWWSWDARLTTTLILWFIYVGYLMLRSYIGEPERAARYSVLVGLLGAIDIPLVHVSVEWWRTLHPQGIIDSASGSPALPGSMLLVFALGTLTMFLLYFLLMGLRVHLELTREAVTRIEEQRIEDADLALPAPLPTTPAERRALDAAPQRP